MKQTFLIGVRDGGTIHDVYMLEMSASTIEAILEPRRPYVGCIAVRRFALDLRDPISYVEVLLRMLEPWLALARSAVQSKVPRSRTDAGRNHATSTELLESRRGVKVKKSTEVKAIKRRKDRKK